MISLQDIFDQLRGDQKIALVLAFENSGILVLLDEAIKQQQTLKLSIEMPDSFEHLDLIQTAITMRMLDNNILLLKQFAGLSQHFRMYLLNQDYEESSNG